MNQRHPKALAIIFALLLLAGCAGGVEGLGRDNGMPSDVNRFLKDRATCNTYSQDALFDDDVLGLAADQGALFCSGSEEQLARLRSKYSARPDVLRALDRLETQIDQGTR